MINLHALMKVLSFSDGKSASETKLITSFNVMQNITKLKKVGSSLSREMPSMLWFVSSGSDLQTTGIILQALCRHYNPDETKPGPRDLGWRGGRREDEDMEVSRHGGLSGPSLGSGQPRCEAGPQHIEVTAAKSVSRGGNWTEETIYARL